MNDETRRLEEKIAYLERHVSEQDKVMLELAEAVARLRREFGVARARLEQGDAQAANEADERPPHY